MQLTLNIYDHGVVMHGKFHKDVISYRGVIALGVPLFNYYI